ncbi:hypothetical protein CSA56_00225 [candidate division KSB3 bacterium]|uniref:Uncharacterized protein n=1 Tax=candidate division KSB3 bacterium TaxID=2044937 RepID=A0A2G6KLG0_9BACT|nr:MAG: hypothetical protein CSA56_00225 [candidate division KSB3 bacterium]
MIQGAVDSRKISGKIKMMDTSGGAAPAADLEILGDRKGRPYKIYPSDGSLCRAVLAADLPRQACLSYQTFRESTYND